MGTTASSVSETAPQNSYVKDIFRRLREHGYDEGTMTLYITGGGRCRQIFREELSEVSFVAPTSAKYTTVDAELTEEQKAENDENVLSDLTAFF